METIKYLTTIINLIKQQPKIGIILDEDGLNPETSYGQINIYDYDAFTRLHSLLDNIKEAETTPIHETDDNTGYDFTVTAPATIHFHYWM